MAKKSTKKAAEATEGTTPVEELKTEEKVAEEKPKELTEEEKQQQEEEEKEKQLRVDSFRKAGEIFKKVLEYIKPKVVVGVKLLDLCEDLEKKIKELGGDIGFPANICLNDIAAHYSPSPDDTTVIAEGDIVKVDFGVAIEGYVVDGAFTVSFNKDEQTKNLILAVETAVLKGLGMIKPGVKTNEIGKATYDIIKGFGYNPIKALSGHLIDKYQIHGGKEIPNVPTPSGQPFEEGEVYAIECFASTGAGNIHKTNNCEIFSYDIDADRIPIRNNLTRKVHGWIYKNKKTLPFSSRELLQEFKLGKFALRELKQAGKLIEHFVLREEKAAHVAQYEHTFMVTKDGIERLT